MTKDEWLKAAIAMVFAAEDDDVFAAWFVKYLLSSVREELEKRGRPISVKGGARAPRHEEKVGNGNTE